MAAATEASVTLAARKTEAPVLKLRKLLQLVVFVMHAAGQKGEKAVNSKVEEKNTAQQMTRAMRHTLCTSRGNEQAERQERC